MSIRTTRTHGQWTFTIMLSTKALALVVDDCDYDLAWQVIELFVSLTGE